MWVRLRLSRAILCAKSIPSARVLSASVFDERLPVSVSKSKRPSGMPVWTSACYSKTKRPSCQIFALLRVYSCTSTPKAFRIQFGRSTIFTDSNSEKNRAPSWNPHTRAQGEAGRLANTHTSERKTKRKRGCAPINRTTTESRCVCHCVCGWGTSWKLLANGDQSTSIFTLVTILSLISAGPHGLIII